MKTKADLLMLLSVIAVILAGWVFLFAKAGILGLAGTQWILIAIILGIYGIYAKLKM